MKQKRKPGRSQDRKDSQQKLDGTGSQPPEAEVLGEQYISYFQAEKLLIDRLNAAPEEIAMWCWLKPEDGGLEAYLDPFIYKPPIKFRYCMRLGSDYRIPLMTCWFRVEDVTKFHPGERYISSPKLIERWSIQLGPQTEPFIQAMIDEGELLDSHPHLGPTQWGRPESAVSKEWAIFMLSQIERIEAKHFPKDLPSHQNEAVIQRGGVRGERIIESFSFWDKQRWKALLQRPPQWLEDARIKPVIRREAAFWSPAEVGNCVLEYRQKYWNARDNTQRQYARVVPSKVRLGQIIQDEFPHWLPDWRPDLD